MRVLNPLPLCDGPLPRRAPAAASARSSARRVSLCRAVSGNAGGLSSLVVQLAQADFCSWRILHEPAGKLLRFLEQQKSVDEKPQLSFWTQSVRDEVERAGTRWDGS